MKRGHGEYNPKPASLFSSWRLESPRCHSYMTSQTELVLWGAPGKVGILDVQSNSFLPQWEVRSCHVFFWSYGIVPEVGILARRCPEFLLCFQRVRFYTCPRCKSLSVSFWISHQGIFFLNCSVSIFMGRRRVQGFLLILPYCRHHPLRAN